MTSPQKASKPDRTSFSLRYVVHSNILIERRKNTFRPGSFIFLFMFLQTQFDDDFPLLLCSVNLVLLMNSTSLVTHQTIGNELFHTSGTPQVLHAYSSHITALIKRCENTPLDRIFNQYFPQPTEEAFVEASETNKPLSQSKVHNFVCASIHRLVPAAFFGSPDNRKQFFHAVKNLLMQKFHETVPITEIIRGVRVFASFFIIL